MAYSVALQTILQIMGKQGRSDPEVELLQRRLILLRRTVCDNKSLFYYGENMDLGIRITEAVNKAQNAIESGLLDLKHISEEFMSICKKIVRLQRSTDDPAASSAAVLIGLSKLLSECYLIPSPSARGELTVMFGFDKQIDQLVDRLINSTGFVKPLFMAIVGIGGSGKTTLVQHVYEKIAGHFEICGWVQSSRPFTVRSTLIALLKQWIPVEDMVMHLKTDQELGECMDKILTDMKYLLVLDDVCNVTVWDALMMFFPNNIGSRVILTTRKQIVADRVPFFVDRVPMGPIDEDASWKLIYHQVFGPNGDYCSTKFREIGMEIACNCKGIPLVLTTIARLLRGKIRLDFWKDVERTSRSVDKSEQVDSIEEQLLKMLNPACLPSFFIDPGLEKTVVGFDRDISQLVDQITSASLELQIIPVVGVGGSGKTTLAEQVYGHSSITDSFNIRAWVTISQEFHLRAVLLGLLHCLVPNEIHLGDNKELGIHVLKILTHKRFIIVVDDIWKATTWDQLREFFPDDLIGSRIILTTREWSLADYAKSSSNPHGMQPLDEDASWEVIFHTVFGGNELCPLELVETGRKIAHKCRGLPLALTTVAGILSKSKKTVGDWKLVECGELWLPNQRETRDNPYLKGLADLFCKDAHQLLDLITGGESQLKIIPIVGQGDSGKTTLARLLYDRFSHAGHFDIHAWVASSEWKEVQLQPLLRNLFNSLREDTKSMSSVNDNEVIHDHEVANHVHKMLYARRYLIVLDGMKDNNTWDMLMRFFQDNNNGSRIILTAKEWTLYDCFGIKSLRVDSYWEFLLQRAFEQDSSSPDLNDTRTKVSEKTQIFWKLVGQEIISSGETNNDGQSGLISTSYNHLPPHLKLCFLYMAAFPEDHVVKVSKIINLWIAEGFFEPLVGQVSEDMAETFLEDLVGRNLLSVCRRIPNGKVKAFRIHDVFWKFCQKKACEENFLWYKDLEGENVPEDEASILRVSVESLCQETDLTDLDSAESFFCIGRVSQDIDPTMFWGWREMRVFDVFQFEFVHFPEEMLELVNLRYLAFTCHADIPSSISRFQSLQTLVVAKASSLPSELWKIEELRHIKCNGTWIWHHHKFVDGFSVGNLQSLSNIPASLISGEFLRKFSCLRKLEIFCDTLMHTVVDLTCLERLENLKCSGTRDFLSCLRYPRGLVRLTLRFCEIHREDMCIIGALHCLEQLKLQECTFTNQLWETVGGEFSRLSSLQMEDLNLVRWEVDWHDFPTLQYLVIRGCSLMCEIPHFVGRLDTLQLIEVDNSSPGVVASALQIKDQVEYGNDLLRVIVSNTTNTT